MGRGESTSPAPQPPQPVLTSPATVKEIEAPSDEQIADHTVADRKDLESESSAMIALAPTRAPSRQHDADEIALMIKTGADLMANRDFAAARLMYQRAAEAGSAMAAFALAETYDPLVVGRLNARGGITPDVALAQMWYEKAKDLGSTVAPERLERLARLPELPE